MILNDYVELIANIVTIIVGIASIINFLVKKIRNIRLRSLDIGLFVLAGFLIIFVVINSNVGHTLSAPASVSPTPEPSLTLTFTPRPKSSPTFTVTPISTNVISLSPTQALVSPESSKPPIEFLPGYVPSATEMLIAERVRDAQLARAYAHATGDVAELAKYYAKDALAENTGYVQTWRAAPGCFLDYTYLGSFIFEIKSLSQEKAEIVLTKTETIIRYCNGQYKSTISYEETYGVPLTLEYINGIWYITNRP